METASESVSETLCYKQRAEKSTGAEMVLMKWSPVTDLLAAAFSDRSVSVVFLSPRLSDCMTKLSILPIL